MQFMNITYFPIYVDSLSIFGGADFSYFEEFEVKM